MASRLLPIELFRGHWKALSDYRDETTHPDRFTRAVLLLVPAGAFIAMLTLPDARLGAPGALLSGVALLAGSFLAAWGQISSMRLKLTERTSEFGDTERVDRDALDESAAHLLVASLFSGAAALMLVLGMNFMSDPQTGAIHGFFAAMAVAFASYVLLLFLIAVPRLYTAYVTLHSVRNELNGTHRSRR
ncbi:hypothetical protein ACRQ4B_02670 [Curtobacterium sp. SP.BCo]|uniref:hypothetical protein n=1 Tax=Curtobacterium sp. SP.BCo TaxID=3435229 RepID=UPI003F741663